MPQPEPQIFEATNPQQQKLFIQQFCQTLNGNEVIAFYGDLGSGKTFSIGIIAEYFGVTEPVSSPSFNLMNEYQGDIKIYHIDLYRIKDPVELEFLRWDYLIQSDGLILIEWADKAENFLPPERIDIEIDYVVPQGRKLVITRKGD